MSIFTFRKIMFAKKFPPFRIFRIFAVSLRWNALALGRKKWNECIRKTQKNGKKREKWADFGTHSGEMERNILVATCEHNYGATFSRSWVCREHIVLR
jgi:hypothetical protein